MILLQSLIEKRRNSSAISRIFDEDCGEISRYLRPKVFLNRP